LSRKKSDIEIKHVFIISAKIIKEKVLGKGLVGLFMTKAESRLSSKTVGISLSHQESSFRHRERLFEKEPIISGPWC
jgi:hypothetical protein